MFPELTNLLPRHRIRAFRRGYFLRLGTLALLLLAGIVIAHGLLLLPAYLYAKGEVARETTQLASLNARLQNSEEKQVQIRLAALADNVKYLGRLSTTPTASAAISAVLKVPRTGITLSGFTFTPPTLKEGGRMVISGTASSRDTLRAYALALGQLSFVTNADLPISAYAMENNIPFTITLTGTLTP